jgi:hypothetical protein
MHNGGKVLLAVQNLYVRADTYTSHNEQKRGTSMLSAGFERATSVIKGLQTLTLDRTATAVWKNNEM